MYGQYSAFQPKRYTLDDYRRFLAWKRTPCGIRRPVTCTGHNRAVVTWGDGTTEFYLHKTPVVTLVPYTRTLILKDGEWPTKTTRRAISQGILELTTKTVLVWGDGKYGHELSNGIQFRGEISIPYAVWYKWGSE